MGQDAIAEAEIHLRGLQLVADRPVHEFEHLGGRLPFLRVDGCGTHDQRHDQCGRESVPRHVTDHDSHATTRELQYLIEVSPHRFGRQDSGRRVDAGYARDGRDELHLEIVGQLHFPGDSLPGQTFLNQSVVLESRADLTRDRGEEFLITRREPSPTAPADQVDDAHGFGVTALRREANGNGEPRILRLDRGLPDLILVCLVRRADQRPPFLEDAGRNRCGIVRRDRRAGDLLTHGRS